MQDIKSRADISALVNTFYSKIREDEMLGPIFNKHIPEDKWPEHLSKLTNFWESNLFDVRKFKGNPSAKHINVDKNLGHTIDQAHFGRWINLWVETLNELFEGEIATKAKDQARKMASGQFITIWQNRPESHKGI